MLGLISVMLITPDVFVGFVPPLCRLKPEKQPGIKKIFAFSHKKPHFLLPPSLSLSLSICRRKDNQVRYLSGWGVGRSGVMQHREIFPRRLSTTSRGEISHSFLHCCLFY